MARQQKGQKEKAQPNNSQYKTKDKRQKKQKKNYKKWLKLLKMREKGSYRTL